MSSLTESQETLFTVYNTVSLEYVSPSVFKLWGVLAGLGVEDADQVSEFTQFESSLGPLLRIIPPLSPLIPCHSPRIGTSRVGLR